MNTTKNFSSQRLVNKHKQIVKAYKEPTKLSLLCKLMFLLSIVFFSTTNMEAQNERKHAINVCAIAIPTMNLYVLNYEYLYHQRHGLAVRAEYAADLSGEGANGTGMAGVLNYRWHFSPKLDNFFIGVYGRYRYVSGSGIAEGINYDFSIPEVNLGVNGGYRWVSKIGINVVLAAGYGYSWGSENITPLNEQVISNFNAFKKAESYIEAPYYGEVSIGYAF